MMKRLASRILIAMGLATSLVGVAHAAYPDRVVTLVVPYAAGGPTDAFARALAEAWGQALNTPMVVENRAGAGTVVGTARVANAPADGYTVLLATVAHAVNASLQTNLPFDPVTSFKPVGLAAKAPLVLVVNNDLPVKTLPEFLDYLKKNPGKVSYGSAGLGSAPHLGGALLNHMGPYQALHVPYRGSAPAMNDLMGGVVAFMLDSAPTGLAQVKSGNVRLLGTSMKERLPLTPDVPALHELLPGYEAYTWNAVLVPAGTPDAVVEKLRSSLETVLRSKPLQDKTKVMGLVLEESPTPDALKTFIDDEIVKWKAVVNASDMAKN